MDLVLPFYPAETSKAMSSTHWSIFDVCKGRKIPVRCQTGQWFWVLLLWAFSFYSIYFSNEFPPVNCSNPSLVTHTWMNLTLTCANNFFWTRQWNVELSLQLSTNPACAAWQEGCNEHPQTSILPLKSLSIIFFFFQQSAEESEALLL